LPFKYLPATLSANEGRIINTFIKRSLINISLKLESGLSGPEAVKTTNIPIIPKVTEAYINTRVAIFCMVFIITRTSLYLAPGTGFEPAT
jgi:hypothetical protein